MKIRKAIAAAALALVFGAGTVSAATSQPEAPNCGKFGLGYQGVVAGSFLQGVSGRYWFDNNVAGELNLFYGRASVEMGSSELGKGDLLLGTAKILYAPVVKTNSRFYVGVEGGLGSIDGNIGSSMSLPDTSVWTAEPLFGAEFNFTEFPELGVNFEVGYKWHHVNSDLGSNDLDINLDGTTVAFGAHYYF
ncbi:hypothetical protein [Pelodictyon phaeoclathratiforme]|jgi:hypothetical protein|uniref:Outer membrane protein beta-barrel domain-containing protein n=1 Tax=Pelodictyon phaeoclathratiforme (strain DSM 5477 / BU-1) TaxID=324925 RepID=B4SEX3_PELPB|nr:hypothetical protein [Pelodictyon phaeoclathratiforme]ACF44649.1 hypothetical protein Ppha_2465 [Pelodictyon phaeoclathratiforme BU-1]